MTNHRSLFVFLIAFLALAAVLAAGGPAAAQDGSLFIVTDGRPAPQITRGQIPPGVGRGGANAAQAAPAPAPIRLVSGTFVPGPETAGTVRAGLAAAADQTPRAYIVQFRGPIRVAWQQALAAAGIAPLGYLPDNAYKVRLTPAQAAQLAAQPHVSWVGEFLPQYKRAAGPPAAGAATYRVLVEEWQDAAAAETAVAATGAQVLRRSGEIITVRADGAQVAAITAVSAVAWLEPWQLPQTHNEFAGGIMNAPAAHLYGWDGRTQTVAVTDTGLGAHRDIPAARIRAIQNFSGPTGGGCRVGAGIVDDGAIDVDVGHGTHVAGSVLGGGGPDGAGRGTAPAARLLFQAVENFVQDTPECRAAVGAGNVNRYLLVGIPDDLQTLYSYGALEGASIHANSWGSAVAGLYTVDSANTDAYVHTNEAYTITFSAGNAGVDANNDGVVDPGSIGSPGTAKNVITVGASEGTRADNFPCDTALPYASHDLFQGGQTCSGMGGGNILGTGARWGFTANPLRDDPTAGNAQQMASFSSRGPAYDGRIKPDVVAPGTWVLSPYSPLYREGYDPAPNPQNGAFQYDGWGLPRDSFYKYMGGTSMSNPLVAGGAALVRDALAQHYLYDGGAALVKGMLINTAVDLLDENNDGANDNDFPIPNSHEGWGRVDLAAATFGFQMLAEANNLNGLSTGTSYQFPFTVVGGAPFKVTLAWSDYPAAPNAAWTLVNDLDLVLVDPVGQEYWGNDFSGGWSNTTGIYDDTNNVENVFVRDPLPGEWAIYVVGFNVPAPPQGLALVVRDHGVAPQRRVVLGTVALQGRDVAENTAVTLRPVSHPEYPAVTVPVDPQTGAFGLAGLLVAPEDSSYSIDAAAPLYLTNRLAQPVSAGAGPFFLRPTTLRGGDANNDGVVNMLDLGCLGGAYNTSPGSTCDGLGHSDLNGDGITNIQDISIAGGNYLLAAPGSW